MVSAREMAHVQSWGTAQLSRTWHPSPPPPTSSPLCSYLTFRGIMLGSFLTNYSSTDELVNVMRCMFAITQTLTYPLELFVARHVSCPLLLQTPPVATRPGVRICPDLPFCPPGCSWLPNCCAPS